MSVDRERVRELVREELAKRLALGEPPRPARHPALLVVHLPEDDSQELEGPDGRRARPCVIEPGRPCYQSGYCKRLGY